LRDQENREKYIGSDENWEKAENAIINAARDKGLNTVVEYGEAAFLRSKIGFHGKRCFGKTMAIRNDSSRLQPYRAF
jgi:threonyl-tRNA synthetase